MEEMRRFTKAKAQMATALSRLADFFTQRGQAALLWRTCALADKLEAEQFNRPRTSRRSWSGACSGVEMRRRCRP